MVRGETEDVTAVCRLPPTLLPGAFGGLPPSIKAALADDLLSEDHPVLLGRPAVYFSSEVCLLECRVTRVSSRGLSTECRVLEQGWLSVWKETTGSLGRLCLPAQSASLTSVLQRRSPAVEWDRINLSGLFMCAFAVALRIVKGGEVLAQCLAYSRC